MKYFGLNSSIFDKNEMVQNCKVSIVIPTLNQGKYIEDTILSIINQSYKNIELIIVDGGSTDQTVDIIKKYEKHLHFWISEPDNGQSDAINKGLAKATGELFNWLNSDDFLEIGAIEHLVTEYRKNPDKLVYIGKCVMFISSNKKARRVIQTTRCKTSEESIFNYSMSQPSTFYKTDIVRSLGEINTSLHYSMDLELWLRFLLQYGIENAHYTDSIYAHFRLHEQSKTVSFQEQFNKEDNQIIHYIISTLSINKIFTDHFGNSKLTYSPTKQWKINKVSKQSVELYLAEKLHYLFFDHGYKKALRHSLWILFKNGKFCFSRYHFSLLFKSIFKRQTFIQIKINEIDHYIRFA